MNSPPMSLLLSIGTSMSMREPYRPRRLGIRANLPHAKTSRNRGSRGPRGALLPKPTTVGPAEQARNSSAATTPCRPDFSWSSASFPDDQRLSPNPFSLLFNQLTRAGPHPSPRAPGRPRHGTSPAVVRHGRVGSATRSRPRPDVDPTPRRHPDPAASCPGLSSRAPGRRPASISVLICQFKITKIQPARDIQQWRRGLMMGTPRSSRWRIPPR